MHAQANQQLSNLSGTVAINLSLLPGSSTLDLGSSSSGVQWRNLYLKDATDNVLIHYGGTDRFLHINGGQVTGDFPEGLYMGEDAGTLAADDNNGCVGLGYAALSAMDIGNHNTAVGWRALINMDGNAGGEGEKNTMVGSKAGEFISTGSMNTGVGWNVFTKSSGAGNISGIGNIAIGAAGTGGGGILGSLGGGDYNVVAGAGSGLGITTGSYNIIVGSQSGTTMNTGDNNTIIGEASGTNLSSGQDNVFIGEEAGNVITDGENNIMIGSGANYITNTSDLLNIGNTLYGSIGVTKKIGVGSSALPSMFNVGTTDQFQVSNAGKIVEYNDITLDVAGNGVPSEIEVIDLEDQNDDITDGVLLTNAPAGFYRITYQGLISSSAGSSSALAFQVMYTDPDVSGTVTIPSNFITYVNSITNNTLKDGFSGTLLINVSSGTTINYKTVYSSNHGAGSDMEYSLRVVLEKL